MRRTTLLLAALAVATLPACDTLTGGTITGSIIIPGGQGKAPIGTISYSHTWPRTMTNPVITGVTIREQQVEITPATIEAAETTAPEPPLPIETTGKQPAPLL